MEFLYFSYVSLILNTCVHVWKRFIHCRYFVVGTFVQNVGNLYNIFVIKRLSAKNNFFCRIYRVPFLTSRNNGHCILESSKCGAALCINCSYAKLFRRYFIVTARARTLCAIWNFTILLTLLTVVMNSFENHQDRIPKGKERGGRIANICNWKSRCWTCAC